MYFSTKKKDNESGSFLNFAIMRFRRMDLFSDLKMEQKNRIVLKRRITFKLEQRKGLNQSKTNNAIASLMRCCSKIKTESDIQLVKTSKINDAGAS